MARLKPLTEEERSELIAYLDGELDAKTARAVETKINLDPRTRQELETLRRTWAMLDYLPRPEPSPAFTSTTLQRASALRPATATKHAKRGWNWPALPLGWAAAVLLAAIVGFTGMRAYLHRNRPAVVVAEPADVDQQLVRDLRIIENKQLYELVGDIDFLRKLDDPDLFGDDG